MVITRHLMDVMVDALFRDAECRGPARPPAGAGGVRQNRVVGGASSWTRGGSGERWWGAGGWEDDRGDRRPERQPLGRWFRNNARRKIDADVRRRREWRDGRAPVCRLGCEQALGVRYRRPARLRSRAVVTNTSRRTGDAVDAEQRELQGDRG
ncbi:MAG TPA: hypothetical protein VFZ21_02110 [Gemmatimonadaceae bacterium]|nr:hypothetical protein [Gemmatimonadaceae bacterium]